MSSQQPDIVVVNGHHIRPGANLNNINLAGARLNNVDLTGASAQHVNLNAANLTGTFE